MYMYAWIYAGLPLYDAAFTYRVYTNYKQYMIVAIWTAQFLLIGFVSTFVKWNTLKFLTARCSTVTFRPCLSVPFLLVKGVFKNSSRGYLSSSTTYSASTCIICSSIRFYRGGYIPLMPINYATYVLCEGKTYHIAEIFAGFNFHRWSIFTILQV